MFRKTAYGIKTQNGQYLNILTSRFGIDFLHEDTPERALIWGSRQQAEEILFHAEQHLGEKCEIVEFELIQQS